MKVGIRTPNLKKSLKAKTTGRAKRAMKGAVNPLYGKKGMGMINNPKKAIYSKVYNKTSISAKDALNGGSSNKSEYNTGYEMTTEDLVLDNNIGKKIGISILLLILSFIFLPSVWFLSALIYVMYAIVILAKYTKAKLRLREEYKELF